MSTLLQLSDQVKQIWKRDDTTILQPKTAINQTYKAMLNVIGHHKLQDRVYKNIIKGQYQISMPSGFLRINHPIKLIDPAGGDHGINSGPLQFLSKDDYDIWEPSPELWVTGDGGGTPWGYCIWKSSIYITAIPDKTYTLEINHGGQPVDLLADVDEPILSSVLDETIVAGSLHRLFSSVKLYVDSEYWRKVYLNGSEGDGSMLTGGLNLLRQQESDNFRPVMIVKNQPL